MWKCSKNSAEKQALPQNKVKLNHHNTPLSMLEILCHFFYRSVKESKISSSTSASHGGRKLWKWVQIFERFRFRISSQQQSCYGSNYVSHPRRCCPRENFTPLLTDYDVLLLWLMMTSDGRLSPTTPLGRVVVEDFPGNGSCFQGQK